jgi:hypothetical protein
MQAMQLLASGAVTMAAGAMISLSFALTPPVTMPAPGSRLADANGNVTLQQHRDIEMVGAAIADTFERRWQSATNDIPPMSVLRRDPLDGLIGGLLTVPLMQDTPQTEPQESLAQQDTPQPERQESLALDVPPAQPPDVCTRHGLRRVDYMKNRHRYWRCAVHQNKIDQQS